MKKILLVTGEASGDLNGAALIRSLQKLKPDLDISAIGGPRIEQTGTKLLYSSALWASIGIPEAISRIPQMHTVLRATKDYIIKSNCHLLVLIDFSTFNIQLAKFAKLHSIPTIYYFPPSTWTGNLKRVREIGELVSCVVATFAYTFRTYQQAGVKNIRYFGHPLIDMVKTTMPGDEAYKFFNLDKSKPVVCLLPGSRLQEIDMILPILLKTARFLHEKIPQIQYVLPVALAPLEDLIRKKIKLEGIPVQLTFDKLHDLLSISQLALMTSGTVALEAAILETPMIITYRVPGISWMLAKAIYKNPLPFVGLPNLIAEREVVPELLQEKCNSDTLFQYAYRYLTDQEKIVEMKKELVMVRNSIGEPGVVDEIAKTVLEWI